MDALKPEESYSHSRTEFSERRSERMRLIRWTVLFLFPVELLSIAALCQQTSAAPGVVRGHVELKDTRAPAKGAVVSLRPTGAYAVLIPASGEYVVRDHPHLGATADQSGAFRIDNVQPGDYELLTYMPDYFDESASLETEGQTVHVLPGERKSIDIGLERGGAIEGQVRFDDGTPAHTGRQAADEVAVSVEIESSPAQLSRIGGAAHTDAEGRYRIGGLPAGKYIVFAALPGEMVPTTRGRESASGRLVFAPRGIRASKAERVEVHPPDTVRGADIVFQTKELYTVSGRVIDPDGAPVTEGLIRLYPTGEPALSQSSPPGKNGEFSFSDLPNEAYTLKYESQANSEIIGLTDDKAGIRIRIGKPPYTPATAQVQISGHSSTDVVLRVRPMT
jgi:hypothetical protein